MNTSDTRQRLLDAAQKLFVQHGIDATSLRRITTEAGANLASVNYHFGSKVELIQAVFARHLEPLNKERIRLLDALEEQSRHDPLPLESILEAFLKPAFEMMKNQKPREFVCLLGRLFTESNDLRMSIMHQFQEVQHRFFAAIGRTLPDLPLEDLTWRAHFMIGAMAHTFAVPERLSIPSSSELYGTPDTDIMHHLIAFAAAGLRAPVSSH
jgi:AcrR family transcriptional regulator